MEIEEFGVVSDTGPQLCLADLREHQVEAVEQAAAELAVSPRATVVMACGTGKTFVGLASAAQFFHDSGLAETGGTFLCLFPSLGLVKQTLETWRAAQPWGDRFRYIAVCSDSKVLGDDDIHVDEIPAEVTTDPETVAKFLRNDIDNLNTVRVIFATYHSAPVVASAVAAWGRPIDFGLFDEAHNTAGKANKQFSLALHDARLPIAKRLFMTATPRVTIRRVRNKEGDFETISMDDEALYGRVAYKLSFRRAVALDLICDYEVLIVTVTQENIVAQGFTDDAHFGAAVERTALAMAIEKTGCRKVITFHPTVNEARAFREDIERLQLLPGFDALHVNGTEVAARRQAMRVFAESEKAIVTNARCLSEGIDIPTVGMVGFFGRLGDGAGKASGGVSPGKRGRADIVQIAGRAMRKADGKEKGYILLPLPLGTSEDPEEAMDAAGMGMIWQVLQALKDEDDLFFGANVVGSDSGSRMGSGGRSSLPITVIGDGDVQRVREAIEVRAVVELQSPFECGLRALRRYVEREGHARVPKGHKEDGFNLNGWVGRQRKAYQAGKLPSERIDALERVPGWSWAPFADQWSMMFALLEKFIRREGHARVPKGHKEDGFNLNAWVGNLRKAYQAGNLSSECIEALARVPEWSWAPFADQWSMMFALLEKFTRRGGHARVPWGHVEDGHNLGFWVVNQRRAYNAGKLSHERINLLGSLPGWSWDLLEDRWSLMFALLKEKYVSREGHACVLAVHVEDGHKLGVWVVTQRQAYKAGKLSSERINLLGSLPGWRWSID